MMYMLLFKLYALKSMRLRKAIRALVTKLEGGQMNSEMLRAIFSKYHNIEIGKYSYGGCFNLDNINAFTKIGRYCSFAVGVRIFNGNHPLEFKSMHPYFYNPRFGYVSRELIDRTRLIIGNDVWIGDNAIITPSVKSIGNGAVIGAGAVVTKDVPDFAVVVGNPAKIIKYRFSQETRHRINASQWWNKSIEELQQDLDEFTRPVDEECDNDISKN